MNTYEICLKMLEMAILIFSKPTLESSWCPPIPSESPGSAPCVHPILVTIMFKNV